MGHGQSPTCTDSPGLLARPGLFVNRGEIAPNGWSGARAGALRFIEGASQITSAKQLLMNIVQFAHNGRKGEEVGLAEFSAACWRRPRGGLVIPLQA